MVDKREMPKRWRGFIFFLCAGFLFSGVFPFSSSGLPAEDVRVVTDNQYFETARKIIEEAKGSIQIVMFEMSYYEEHPHTRSNVLVDELIRAKKRGVKVEVILDIREGADRTTKRNRLTGKRLSAAGVTVIYDSLLKTTHAKLLVADGRLTLIGSTNWTHYALTDNHETAVLIRSKEVAKEFMEYFNRVKAESSAP
jgi:phosphatidylserine/phosphatidylglycerophosphate/cardiolipin synthase-like enzyme